MTLIKQLWIALALLMAVVFLGTFMVSCYSTKHYLETQLYKKNIDNASMIALSLTSQASDPMLMELFINSQFDTGHYKYISLIDMDGNIIAGQKNDDVTSTSPSWLSVLFPVKVKPGYAQVSDGWKRVATLILNSDTDYVYLQLWNNAKTLFYYFVLIGLAAGVAGSVFLRRLTQPLHSAVNQAEAIGERRFIVTDEPKTTEFKAVIRSLNILSLRISSMLSTETEKLEKLRRDIQYDQVTKLLSRDAILSIFGAYLDRDDESSSGAIVLVRINDMQGLNQDKGRAAIDALLKNIGNTLSQASIAYGQDLGLAGRLNGSDFAVIIPDMTADQLAFGRDLLDCVNRCCLEAAMPDIKIYGASTFYYASEQTGEILTRLDSVLHSAGSVETDSCIHIDIDEQVEHRKSNRNWENDLLNAFVESAFSLDFYPVKAADNTVIHLEAPVRLTWPEGDRLTAAQFIPHIYRLDLATKLDFCVVKLALDYIHETKQAVGINISSALLSQPQAMATFAGIIQAANAVSHLLWLEIPEYGVFKNFEGFRTFSQLLKPLRCKIGIEHVGHEISCIGELHDLGIDFVKIDSAYIRDVDRNTSNQIFLRGLCTIVHSIGIEVIAEGVATEEEWVSLKTLGFDGATGRYFS